MGIRRRGRESAFQFLFQLGFSPITDISELESRLGWFTGSFDVNRESTEFMTWLARGVITHLDQIDALIEEAAINWRIDRMNRVDRAILRLAVFEFLKEAQTPGRVIINEAIELAKLFSCQESSRFINGVLDNICHRIRPEEMTMGATA